MHTQKTNVWVDTLKRTILHRQEMTRIRQGFAVQIHLIRASKPANNIREFPDQASI